MNPRTSPDPYIKRALAIWDRVSVSLDPSCEEATKLRVEFQLAGASQAIGWLSLTCGRVEACRGESTSAENHLIDAMGRLHFARDKYGEGLADSHMAIVLSNRGESEMAVKLAGSAFLLPVEFSSLDLAILHNIAAMVNWEGDKCSQAIGHILSEFEIVRRLGRADRHASVLSNLSAVLLELGDFGLSLAASKKALLWYQSLGGSPSRNHLSTLSNVVMGCYFLGRHAEARVHASALFQLLAAPNSQATPQHYLNIIEAFCASGEIKLAEEALARARSCFSELSPAIAIPAHFLIGDAAIREAKKDYEGAAKLSLKVLEQPVEYVRRCGHFGAAHIRSRSCEALGRKTEAKKWREFASKTINHGLLTGVLTGEFRASLDATSGCEPLTPQELTCLRLSASGQSSTDIGVKLGIKPRTVHFHFGKILRKLNATNRQEAIAKAIGANLIPASSQQRGY